MNKSIFGVIGFVLGAAAGSLVTWKLIEKKYMDMADDEIRSVKEMYAQKRCVDPDKREDTPVSNEVRSFNEDELRRVVELVTPYMEAPTDDKPDYTAYSQVKQTESAAEPSEPEVKQDDPYIIDPTEYGEFSEYEQRELTYYKDGVICENRTDMIDPDDIFGDLDVGDHFGEYENDRVFVRDDKRQVDYEILRDERTFMEVL